MNWRHGEEIAVFIIQSYVPDVSDYQALKCMSCAILGLRLAANRLTLGVAVSDRIYHNTSNQSNTTNTF